LIKYKFYKGKHRVRVLKEDNNRSIIIDKNNNKVSVPSKLLFNRPHYTKNLIELIVKEKICADCLEPKYIVMYRLNKKLKINEGLCRECADIWNKGDEEL